MTPKGLVDVVHWLEDLLDRLGVERSYGGALAYNYYGPPRLTQDVDVLVLLPDTRVPALVEELKRAGCTRADDKGSALDLRAFLADLRGPGRFTAVSCFGVRVELFVPWHAFHHRVLQRSPERHLAGRPVRVHAAEDLIVFKKAFDRPKDVQDIKAILLARGDELELDRIRTDAQALLDPASWDELDAMLRRYATPPAD